MPKTRWFAYAAFGACCLILAYLLIWQRGLYSDDYNLSTTISATAHGGYRPLGFLLTSTAAYLVAQGLEWLPRLIQALLVGGNALLLGAWVYRLTRQALPAVVVAWLALMPIFAIQGVLWTASMSYLAAGLCALLGLHVAVRYVDGKTPLFSFWSAATIIAFMLATLFYEGVIALVALIWLLAWSHRQRGWRVLLRPALMTGLLAAFGLFLLRVVYVDNPYATARGDLDLNPLAMLQRIVNVHLPALYELTIAPYRLRYYADESFAIGQSVILQHIAGIGMVLAAIVLLGWLSWRALSIARTSPEQPSNPGFIIAIGVTWLLVTTFFPVALIDQQVLFPRMLYIPSLGLAIAIGGLLMPLLRQRWLAPVLMLITGLIVLYQSVIVVGYAHTFALRYQLDRRQISQFALQYPVGSIPKDTYLLPIGFDRNLIEGYEMDQNVFGGIFDWYYAADIALNQMGYRHIATIDSRDYEQVQLAVGQTNIIFINGVAYAQDAILPLTYANDQLLVVRQITTQTNTYIFPVAQQMAAQGYVTTTLTR